MTQLTFDSANDWFPVWTPDSKRVIFASTRDGGVSNLFWIAADGTGAAERLTEAEQTQYSYSISPDGKRLIFGARGPTSVRALPMDGEQDAFTLIERGAMNSEVSPDGNWIAFQSQGEIYVLPFPDTSSGLRRVSTDGGQRPVWDPDGGELFYQNGSNLMVVPLRSSPTLNLLMPRTVFADPDLESSGLSGRTFDVGRDGRLLINAPVRSSSSENPDIVFVEKLGDRLPAEGP